MKAYLNYLFLIAIGSLFFIPFNGNVHLFDWDEVNFAEISREMIVTGDFLKVQINYQPFFEKPPLFFWLQVLAMKVFGINEFAARFPNAIVGIITLMVLFRTGTFLFNTRFGMIWALAYFGSVLPHVYFKSGIIDPLFNLFIFLGLYFFLKFKWSREGIVKHEKNRLQFFHLTLAGLFIGLALLTKGPVAYLIVILCFAAYWIKVKFKMFISVPWFIYFSLVAFVIMFTWFGLEMFQNGPAFMKEFVVYQLRLFTTPDAGHSGFPGFHLVVLLFGCFPASVFAIRGFYKMKSEKKFQQDFRIWMIILFWVVVVLFSFVQSKIVHYSSLAYFPLTFLSALVISNILEGKIKLNRWMRSGLVAIGSIFILLTVAAPFVGRNIQIIKPFFQGNPEGLASLNAEVNWTGWEALTGLVLLGVLIVFLVLLRKKKSLTAFRILFLGTAVVVFLVLIFYVGKIEMYSQNAHVEFAKSIEGKEGYVKTSGFKSYVHYFYSKRMPPVHEKSDDIGWLTWEPVDKDVYIITRIHLKEYWSGVPTVEIIGEKNGFLFVKRRND
jgi:4-amino-4-deoxy-L-arabinose transferase-like glycosyltransferase